jgi:hypothetical protein
MGWEVNPNIIANTVTIVGANGGVFVYNGTPGPGTLVEAIAGTGGTDPYGNSYGPGFTSFGPLGAAAQINSGAIGLFSGLNVISEITPNGIFIYSPSGGLGNLAASITPNSGTDQYGNVYLAGLSAYQVPVTVGTPAMGMQAGIVSWYAWNGSGWGLGAGIDWTQVNGFTELLNSPFRTIGGTRASPTLITTDGRTNFGSFGTGFMAGTPAPWQALMPTGVGGVQDVVIGGQIQSSAATAANATMVSLIKAPAVQQDFVVPTNAAGYTPAAGSLPRVVRVDTSGNVRLLPSTSAASQFVILDGIRVVMG